MNVADTERIGALLTEAGFKAANDPQVADIIMINGCSVREKAVHKAVSLLGTYRSLKQDNQRPILGLGGCVGQLDGGGIFKRAPYLDFVFGTDVIDELPEIIHQVLKGKRHQVFVDFDKSNKFSTSTKIHGKKAQAFVNIMKGCDKRCTYCIVPFTRGREKSRVIDEVLDDVAALVEQKGVREVTLLGQNVNSFGKGNQNFKKREPFSLHNRIGRVGPEDGDENFPQLLWAMQSDPRLTQLRRIRFTSSHPLDFSDELLECFASGTVTKLARHLHLAVQSGSDKILHKMGRKHKIGQFIEQMERLKALDSEIGLSTDFIVGFPGETVDDFEATLDLMKRLQFDSVFAFMYSPRPGTVAAKFEDDVPESVKSERLNMLLGYQLEIAQHKYSRRVGKTMEVLVEGPAKSQNIAVHGKLVWSGRTSCNRVVNFVYDKQCDMTGKFVDVLMTASTSLSLTGELK